MVWVGCVCVCGGGWVCVWCVVWVCVCVCVCVCYAPCDLKLLSRLNLVQEDLVIQMSVRRAPSSAVCRPCFFVFCFLSGAFLGNRMPYLDNIWYVGGARAEVAHAEFWAWHMLIKYLFA